ncbi:MAG TPA: CBS domain-containing protein [Bacteroidetes bacterium]|nr:CBS domain-containing protein [Bacteroidota bacterium]
MIARDLISDSVPSIKTSDFAGRVLAWLSEFKVRQLPVVNNEELLGLVTEDDLLDTDNDDTPIGNVRLSLPETTYVFEDNHLYEVLRVASAMKLDLIPVLKSRDNTYLGVITSQDLIRFSGEILGVKEPGGIIVLEVSQIDYTLSEIGRICESNDARVLSLTVTTKVSDPSRLFISLKLNIRELSRVVATFERFEYTIAQVIFDSEQLNDYREHYENLLRYLDL